VPFQLEPGDQLLLQSDGFVECPLPDGGMLGEEDLAELFGATNIRGAPFDLLDHLLQQLIETAGTTEFPDDVSAVLIEAQ
jgi:serine phosphatase RsbU (regulator of sigma subunit)